MGWHDATVWSIAANIDAFELLLDLDYIFKWVEPKPGETFYKFWVAPVTLVFENASEVRIDIKSQQGSLEVSEVSRIVLGPSPNGKLTQYAFRFQCQEGEVSLEATGYKMYVRRSPALLERQSYDFDTRGGVSFARNRSDG